MFDYDPQKEEDQDESGELAKKIPIKSVQCGGMHTVALTPTGEAYSWGCNDEGALGRQGKDNQPEQVPLSEKVTNVSCGDSHTVFYSTESSRAFFAGAFRDVKRGRRMDVVRSPTLHGEEIFSERKLVKIVSGVDHQLALTGDGKVWAWGDSHSGKTGLEQFREGEEMIIREISTEGIGQKVVDIFCGNYTSFLTDELGNLYAWGLNNYGQLGVGGCESTHRPTRVVFPSKEEDKGENRDENVKIVQVDGGEHHSIALSSDGKVYVFGNNVEGQAGFGDIYGKYRRTKLNEAYESGMTEAQIGDLDFHIESKAFFSKPVQVTGDLLTKKVSKVFAAGNFCYALCGDSNELYAWGQGDCYVLGTREEDNEFQPKLVHPMQFHKHQVEQVGTGTQHIVVLAKIDRPEEDKDQIQEKLLTEE